MIKPFVFFAYATLAVLGLAAVRARDAKPAPSPILRAAPALSAADKAHLLSDSFTVVKTVKQMPAAVQKALGLPAKDPLDGMADAGKPFEVGDAVSGKLPSRRLILAAVNPQYCLVYYDQGGFVYNQHIVLFRQQNGSVVRVWNATLFARPSLTFAQLRAAIRDAKYQSLAASS